jgi:hypothetical protein
MTSTTITRIVTRFAVVFGSDEGDCQSYTNYGDGAYLSTAAEHMATREFLRLSALRVPCGFWVNGKLTAGEDTTLATEGEDV